MSTPDRPDDPEKVPPPELPKGRKLTKVVGSKPFPPKDEDPKEENDSGR